MRGITTQRKKNYDVARKIHRRRVAMNRVKLILVSIFMITVLSIVCFNMNVKATDSKNADAVKYYTSVVIMPGDTLWDIANEHMDYEHYSSVKSFMKDIAKANNIKVHTPLKSCEYLVVPYYM